MQPTVNEPAFWQGLYESQADRWELGGPTPPLVEYLAKHPRLPGERLAVPGCGRGHDARFLARHGYRVWGFDFAEPAIREARALAGRARVDVTFEQRDVFGLAADYRGSSTASGSTRASARSTPRAGRSTSRWSARC